MWGGIVRRSMTTGAEVNPRTPHLGFATLVASGLVACGGLAKQTPVGEHVEAELTSSEIRATLQEYASYFVAEIEASSNRAARSSSDPRIRKNLRVWKINATSAVYLAAFHGDPWVSSFDLQALVVQLMRFLEAPRGEQAFGPQRTQLLAAVLRLEQLIHDLGTELREARGLKGPGDAWPQIVKFAEANPIEDLEFLRAPVPYEFATALGQEGGGTLSAVKKVETQMTELMNRSRLYADYLPKRAGWQARLVLDEAMEDPRFESLLNLVEVLPEKLDAFTTFIQTAPDLVARERKAVVDAANGTTIDAFERISRERTAVLDEIDEDLREVLQAIRAERGRVLAALREEREAVLGGIEASGRRLIDHAAYRVLQLVGILAALFVLGLLIFVFGVRRRSTRMSSTVDSNDDPRGLERPS